MGFFDEPRDNWLVLLGFERAEGLREGTFYAEFFAFLLHLLPHTSWDFLPVLNRSDKRLDACFLQVLRQL